MDFITLDRENIDKEHICCAFSDKKCTESYEKKKSWLKNEFDKDYVFYRLDERAKVFIEYGPAEKAWLPINAPGWININCFWVSGKYKKNGFGKSLLKHAEEEALKQGKTGLMTVVGKKKFHFMSDGKWFLRQGFKECDTTDAGFVLLIKELTDKGDLPRFKGCAQKNEISDSEDLVVFYSNRCPYAEYHVSVSLNETAKNRGLSLKMVKLKTMEEAQEAPSPATIFSLYYKGRFLTTDISACMDSRFDKLIPKLSE